MTGNEGYFKYHHVHENGKVYVSASSTDKVLRLDLSKAAATWEDVTPKPAYYHVENEVWVDRHMSVKFHSRYSSEDEAIAALVALALKGERVRF